MFLWEMIANTEKKEKQISGIYKLSKDLAEKKKEPQTETISPD